MIDGDLAIAISRISVNLMLDHYSPNQDLLKKVSSFNAEELDSLDTVELSKFITILGQFLVYINYNENLAKIKSMEANRRFDKKILFEIGNRKWKTGITMKEKVFSVLTEVPEIAVMEDEKEVSKYEAQMYDGLYSTILEYMNAYKRELGRRQFTTEGRASY